MSLNYDLIPWDSKVIGKNVLEINNDFDLDNDEYNKTEAKIVSEYSPFMIFCKVPIHDIVRIHYLEEAGFRFMETQFHIVRKIQEKFSIKSDIECSPYQEGDLPKIIEIAKTTFDTDRYSIDPYIGREIAGQRYANWILNSINNKENILLKYSLENEIIGFHLIKVSGKIAHALLGGVREDYKSSGAGVFINLLLNNYLYSMGLKSIDTYISAANIGIFNIDIYMQYKIKDVTAVLRKVFL